MPLSLNPNTRWLMLSGNEGRAQKSAECGFLGIVFDRMYRMDSVNSVNSV